MQFDATIFGGLPVVVEARCEPADREVGIMHPYFEIEAIYTTRTRKRDRKVIMKPIPASWWAKLSRDELGELEEKAAEYR